MPPISGWSQTAVETRPILSVKRRTSRARATRSWREKPRTGRKLYPAQQNRHMHGHPREISTMYFMDISVFGVRIRDWGKPVAPGQPR
jgi:hypothetical protein